MADESDFQLQNSNQAIEFARDSVKSSIVVNGGAAVAVLAFMSSADAPQRFALSFLQSGLRYFAFGVFVAMVASICGYFAQTSFAMHNARRASGIPSSDYIAKIISLTGAILILASAVLFLIGLYTTGKAFI